MATRSYTVEDIYVWLQIRRAALLPFDMYVHLQLVLREKEKHISHLVQKSLPSHRGVAGEVLRAGYTVWRRLRL